MCVLHMYKCLKPLKAAEHFAWFFISLSQSVTRGNIIQHNYDVRHYRNINLSFLQKA